MKTTNIFHKLKASGAYNTDGMKPQLPGLGSPLDKKLIRNQKNLPQELKDKIEDAPETSPANYGSPYKKYKSDAQRKAVHASKAEKSSPATMKGKPKRDSKKVKGIKAGVDKAASELHGGHMLNSAHSNEFFTRDSDGVRLSEKIYKKNPKKSAYYKAVDNSLTSTVRNLEHKRQEKVGVPKTKDKPYGEFRTQTKPKDQFNWRAGKTTYTGRGYGSEPENKKKTADYKSYKAATSPAKKKSCGSPVKMDIEGRKPKTRRNKAQKGVNKMLGGLANANRGCKPHRKIKSR